MIVIGQLIKQSVIINQRYVSFRSKSASQPNTLRRLLNKAKDTDFGKAYNFKAILAAPDIEEAYRISVPIYDYDRMYKDWWRHSIEGKQSVSWPGKVKFFALSSGTSGAPSKMIPVTTEMIQSIRKAGFWHLSSLQFTGVRDDIYKRQMLLLGGSTQLDKMRTSFQGDLSGIMTKNLPPWLNFIYKPGRVIAKEKEWNEKIRQITEKAKDWDVGIISGVPSWVQLLFENIIQHYEVDTIHDIWPNLQVFSHGGVSFKPYQASFEKLLGKEILYLETYLASEGFIAFENRPGAGMELVQNNGMYYEFIPHNETNFSAEGELIATKGIVPYSGVEEGKEYAILITTCAGAWRYLIGDTVAFRKGKIYITGRTKHFLSLCGEHLSVDNMNDAIHELNERFDCTVREYTVIGQKTDNGFEHHWYLGVDDSRLNSEEVLNYLDSTLKELNADYATERKSVLTSVDITILPNETFYSWLEQQNKLGGQTKFPRVLRGEQAKTWLSLVHENDEALSEV